MSGKSFIGHHYLEDPEMLVAVGGSASFEAMLKQNLHQVAGQLAELATLTFHKVDMSKKRLVTHTVNHID